MGQKTKKGQTVQQPVKTEAVAATAPKADMKAVLAEFMANKKPDADDIRKLQTALVDNGAKIRVDGDFGKNTGAALKQYLKDNPAYIATLSPWAKQRLEAVGSPVGVNLNEAEKVIISDFLHLGKPTDAQVEDIQNLLKRNGLYDMKVDGDMGNGTLTGLIKAIEEEPSILKGASPYMLARLQKTVKGDAELSAALISGTKDLLEAKTSDDVTQLQANLALLGYKVGGVDGLRGGRTDAALESFTKDNAKVEAVAVVAKAAAVPAAPVEKAPVAEKKDKEVAKPEVKVEKAPEKVSIVPSFTSILNPSAINGAFGLNGIFADNAKDMSFAQMSGNTKPDFNKHPLYDRLKELGINDPTSFADIATINAADRVLDYIGHHEAGDPNALYGNRDLAKLKDHKRYKHLDLADQLVDMSLDAVHSLQRALPRNKRAAGLLQFMPDTMKNYVEYLADKIVSAGSNLAKDVVKSKIWDMQFDEIGQKLLGFAILDDLGFKRFLEKGNTTSFGYRLAGTWAALKAPSGKGVHDGDVAGNNAYVSWNRTKNILNEARKEYKDWEKIETAAEKGVTKNVKLSDAGSLKLKGVVFTDHVEVASLSSSLVGDTGPLKVASIYNANLDDVLLPQGGKAVKLAEAPEVGLFDEGKKTKLSMINAPQLTMA